MVTVVTSSGLVLPTTFQTQSPTGEVQTRIGRRQANVNQGEIYSRIKSGEPITAQLWEPIPDSRTLIMLIRLSRDD